jgi:hypothetical protein
MNVDKVLDRLRDKCDLAELRRTARAVGGELPRNRIDVLNRFRARSCAIQIDDLFQRGYLEGLLAVTRAYVSVIQAKQDEAELLRTAKQKPGNGVTFFQILEQLKDSCSTVNELAGHFKLDPDEMHQHLDSLSVFWLVQNYNTSRYGITLHGERLLELDKADPAD